MPPSWDSIAPLIERLDLTLARSGAGEWALCQAPDDDPQTFYRLVVWQGPFAAVPQAVLDLDQAARDGRVRPWCFRLGGVVEEP